MVDSKNENKKEKKKYLFLSCERNLYSHFYARIHTATNFSSVSSKIFTCKDRE